MLLESLSLASSDHPWDDETPPAGPSHPISEPSDLPPVTSPLEARENPDTIESPRARSIFRKWLPSKNIGRPVLPKSGRLFGKSREPADARSHSPPRVDVTDKGHSWMAAARRRPVSALH